MKYILRTFGCQQNHVDSERIATYFKKQGMKKTRSLKLADYIVINTCMIRESAENRVYGLVNNLRQLKNKNFKLKIVITGCMAGMALNDKTGKFIKLLKKRLPEVDEFLSLEKIGFNNVPLKTDKYTAYVPISSGCNNFCTYCVVPYARGKEISRSYKEIISECLHLKKKGVKNITLLGQNVNSYGADLTTAKEALRLKPIYVKHLGRYRISTLFPYLLAEIAQMNFEKVDFMSSNPWDFSDELINVIAKNKNITQTIHLPVQSGDDGVLSRMNRWYTAVQYLQLVSKIRNQVPNIKFTTDIIVGFCGETDEEFENTVKLCKKVGFSWAYVSIYSPRPMAISTKKYQDDVSHKIKDKRWKILDDLINKPHLKKMVK
jgi:tRNA-2-methylthio-N6-dimethylallyladenosine synthase